MTTAPLDTNDKDDATTTSTNTSFAITGTVTYTFFQESNGIAGLQTCVVRDTDVISDALVVGVDSCAPPIFQAGTYYYTVHYSGDANFNASDSATETLTINKADTTTTRSEERRVGKE